jgi:predicted TIM-barrel fold metal-dependent hydrolase
VAAVVDSDQHLYESRLLWSEHIDPSARDDALRIEDDELGYPWLTWRRRRISLADVQLPGDTAAVGRHRQRRRQGLAPEYRYDEVLPTDYWEPGARGRRLEEMGLDAAVVFPNYGLLWERPLSGSLPALAANMAAWNRWCAEIGPASGGRLFPVGHLTLRDGAWAEDQISRLAAAGVGLAMIAPAPVDGRPLSDRAHDRMWRAFVDHGVTPVFHVADQTRIFDDAWYTDEGDSLAPVMEAVFLYTAPAVAVTDLIVNGAFERHPGLRVGIVELSSVWVPQYLLMLDGGWDFTNRLNGRAPAELTRRPSEYFLDHVRVSSFSYEGPARLTAQAGDVFMCCSDYPHSEGTTTPLADYRVAGCSPEAQPGLFGTNLTALLGSGGTGGP